MSSRRESYKKGGVADASAAAARRRDEGTALMRVQRLRRLLSLGYEGPYTEALMSGAVPLLIQALQLPRTDLTVVAEIVLEAAWSLTNLAAGDHAVVEAVAPAAPIMIAHLGAGAGLGVAEQCAWALGNIAGESAELRAKLAANGAVRPLTGLVLAARGSLAPRPVIAASRTAAWALSNLIKGAGHEVGEVLSVDNCPAGLVQLLSKADEPELVTEVCWVLTYITAGAEAHLNRMVNAGVVPVLVQRLNEAAAQLQQHADASRARLTPKEAAWTLSNMAGVPGRAGVEVLVAAGALPVLLQVLAQAAFDLRKEVAFAIANICAGGGDGTGDSAALAHVLGSHSQVLPAFLGLMRSPDMEAAQLGLQFTEMVLRVLPEGPQAVEAADGIDAIEELQFKGPPHLQRLAAQLVDKYFGEDYGLE
ncbi:hypothetical protein WJX72_005408 [[Myrmecia] bisecta]|uniref:Importin subunit alpha n=1 Tax=[Myrmecia] bisecta TaxID=41462 RepID=A0AAW1PLD0_9CHLO